MTYCRGWMRSKNPVVLSVILEIFRIRASRVKDSSFDLNDFVLRRAMRRPPPRAVGVDTLIGRRPVALDAKSTLASARSFSTGTAWLDFLISFDVVITRGTWRSWRDSANLALDAVPENIDWVVMKAYLARLPNVSFVHDQHVWGMSTTETSLMTHRRRLLHRVRPRLHDRISVRHVNVQVERQGDGREFVPASFVSPKEAAA